MQVKIILPILISSFALAVPFLVRAADHYVSPTGTASWSTCTNISTPCSLNTANTNAVAGDTVYLRGGEYVVGNRDSTTNPGIKPQNSGTAVSPIVYSTYADEIASLVGQADQGRNSMGIWINGKSYIKVTGRDPYNLRLSKMDANIVIGPWTGADPVGDSSYNEISYVWAYNGFASADWTHWWQGNAVWQSAYYNHIHDCKFEKYGYISTGISLDNEGDLFDLGTEFANSSAEATAYNVIENNEFFHGGHATFGFFGDHNIVRNNYFHNEEWYTVADIDNYPDMKYGYRNIIGDGVPGYVGYNLFEGNRIGHASPNPTLVWVELDGKSGWCEKGGAVCSVDGKTYWHWGGTGMKLCHPYNIVRYNAFFNNASGALDLATYSGSVNARASYNHIYNNTFFHNGWYQKIPGQDYMYTGTISTISYNGQDYSVVYGTVIKNSLFYNNGNTQSDSSVWIFDYPNTLADMINPSKGGLILTNNFNDDAGENVNPLFVSENMNNPYSWILPDLNLQSSSPVIDTGTYLTQTNGAGSSSNTLIVDDALYFQDGNFGRGALAWPANIDIQADWIAIGTVNNVVQIASINYNTNTITLSSPMTWSDNAPIWLYKNSSAEIVLYGSAPDQGAYEYQGTTSNVFSFQFTKQSRTTHSDTATLTLYTPGTSSLRYTISNKTTNSSGLASNITPSETITSGTYDILIKIPYYLPKKLTSQTWPPTNTLNFGILKSGDLNNDNLINSSDLAIILSNWQTSNSTSDLNQDGQVNSLDFSFINSNWNLYES